MADQVILKEAWETSVYQYFPISTQPFQSKEYWPSHTNISVTEISCLPLSVNTQSRAHCWVTETQMSEKGLCCGMIREPSNLSWNLEAVPTIEPTDCARHCRRSENKEVPAACSTMQGMPWLESHWGRAPRQLSTGHGTAGVMSSHLRQGHRSESELCSTGTYLQCSPRPTQPAHWCECVERPPGKWRLELPLHPPLPWFALTCQRRCWWVPRQIQTGWDCSLLCPGMRQTSGSNQPELCCLLGVASLLRGVS